MLLNRLAGKSEGFVAFCQIYRCFLSEKNSPFKELSVEKQKKWYLRGLVLAAPVLFNK